MNLDEKLLLGLNTTIISMIIVFVVLFVISILISIQYRILKAIGVISEKMETPSQIAQVPTAVSSNPVAAHVSKTGLTSGEARLVGVEDEELVAVIMTAVSHASNISLSDLRIRSIKRVDDNWQSTAKQEMANQRL
jgi:hypothetical protein